MAATQARKVERFLFWSNYKGSTDFFTKYVYPPLVWLMVPPLARARVAVVRPSTVGRGHERPAARPDHHAAAAPRACLEWLAHRA